MKHKVKRLMAYIYMPLIFSIIGYGALFLAIRPLLEIGVNVGSMIMVQEVPTFHTELESVFKEPPIVAEEQPDSIQVDSIQMPAYGQQYGRLTCERIGLESPVYYGDNNEILRVGAGQYIGSFLPGWNRPILLCAHNTTFFKPLQDVMVGDIFTFTTSYGVYQYEVTDTRVADRGDGTAYDLLQEEEQLIMYTCYPFETLVGTKTDRLFVYARKVIGPVVVD